MDKDKNEVLISDFFTDEYRTWYRITNPAALHDKAPIIVLHGGPGAGHDYMLPYTDLTVTGRSVIHYDQVGCGRSSHLVHKPKSFWQVQPFVEQLELLIKHLKIDQIVLLGHSWGGILATEYAIKHDDQIEKLILSSCPSAMKRWEATGKRLINELPEKYIQAFKLLSDGASVDRQLLDEAIDLYTLKFCENIPEAEKPDYLKHSAQEMNNDGTTYDYMWGRAEPIVNSGNLANWDAEDRLHNITTPTLVIAGEHDEAGIEATKNFSKITGFVKEIRYPGGAHIYHITNHNEVIADVSSFINGSN
ncbi:prolyl aminopeptidase [Secundilactobacillus pentosiphilus]|uniref:Proline iminopeptidase n=1 Tax=Secundilactobacillus pentosiphilus TaxID=1714682 RepID=A0A1Z5IXQ1_9LACO|nr:proline iminopeptidase-family hydrolase [Secundilactobacillus pentosiphilus]GAX06372.1 prolyl aminopeptidase [Secundilactobacillus pentosiphilus]